MSVTSSSGILGTGLLRRPLDLAAPKNSLELCAAAAAAVGELASLPAALALDLDLDLGLDLVVAAVAFVDAVA